MPSGSLSFMFNRKAVFEVELPSGDLEELELELIDYGLELLEQGENSLMIYGDYKSFGTLSDGIEKCNLTLKKGSLQYIPNSTISLNDEELSEIEKLLDKLDDDDDIQAVYTNIE